AIEESLDVVNGRGKPFGVVAADRFLAVALEPGDVLEVMLDRGGVARAERLIVRNHRLRVVPVSRGIREVVATEAGRVHRKPAHRSRLLADRAGLLDVGTEPARVRADRF